MSDERARLKREDDRRDTPFLERVFMVLSAAVTLSLFGFTLFMAVTAPSPPVIDVSVARVDPQADQLYVYVEVANRGERGFQHVVVEVTCDDPAPQGTLPIVPANGTLQIIIVCPADSNSTAAQLVSMMPA